MFIDIEGQTAIALSQVRSKRDGQVGRVSLELVAGDKMDVPHAAWEAALDRSVTLATPAPAETWLVLEDHSDETIRLSTVVIVAFVVTARGLVRALTGQGILDADAVLFADGHVEAYDRDPLPSFQAYADEIAHATGKQVVY